MCRRSPRWLLRGRRPQDAQTAPDPSARGGWKRDLRGQSWVTGQQAGLAGPTPQPPAQGAPFQLQVQGQNHPREKTPPGGCALCALRVPHLQHARLTPGTRNEGRWSLRNPVWTRVVNRAVFFC